MKHIFKPGLDATKPVLLLLHGTGGTEQDLLPLADLLDSEAAVLSVRGNVLENGSSRYFRRLAEGVFDEADLAFRTKELYEFLQTAAKEYRFDPANVIAVGYSNGANIAANLLFQYKDALRGASLHHPMVPRRGVILPDLTGTKVFITAGENDPICPASEAEDLSELLIGAGAEIEILWERNGHSLTGSEVAAAAKWYNKEFKV